MKAEPPLSRKQISGDGGSSTVAVSSITVTPTTMTLTAGGATGTITATVAPVTATNKNITWSSSNEAVATVVNGIVTPVAMGTATITATSETDHTKTAATEVNKKIDSSVHIVKMGPIDHEEASKILAQYLTQIIEQVLANVKDSGGRVENQIALCNRLIDIMVAHVGEASLTGMSIDGHAKILLALLARENSANAINENIDIIRPVTSIAFGSRKVQLLRIHLPDSGI